MLYEDNGYFAFWEGTIERKLNLTKISTIRILFFIFKYWSFKHGYRHHRCIYQFSDRTTAA